MLFEIDNRFNYQNNVYQEISRKNFFIPPFYVSHTNSLTYKTNEASKQV